MSPSATRVTHVFVPPGGWKEEAYRGFSHGRTGCARDLVFVRRRYLQYGSYGWRSFHSVRYHACLIRSRYYLKDAVVSASGVSFLDLKRVQKIYEKVSEQNVGVAPVINTNDKSDQKTEIMVPPQGVQILPWSLIGNLLLLLYHSTTS